MKSVIVMTVIGNVPRQWQPDLDDTFPAPPGFCWRFVPEGPFAVQLRSIVRVDARAVAVWVGQDNAIDRAVSLIAGLLQAGLPIVIAVAEAHDPLTESVLRQAGALYLCANEAEQQLGEVLKTILGPRSRLRSTDVKMVESMPDARMDAG